MLAQAEERGGLLKWGKKSPRKTWLKRGPKKGTKGGATQTVPVGHSLEGAAVHCKSNHPWTESRISVQT